MAKFDIKKAAISHVEKVVFGIVILVVLIGLAGTKWSPYKGTAGEIVQKVESGKRNLVGHRWPDEEKELYPIVQTTSLVDRALYTSIDPRPLESSVDPIVDPRGQNEPVREPVLKKPEELIAGAGRVFLHLAAPLEETTATDLAAVTDDKKEDENIIDELRIRENTGAMGIGEAYPGAGNYADAAMELSSEYGAYDSTYDGSYAGAGMEGSTGGVAVKPPRLNGQGYHFASVRAVFPLRDQITKFADATNQSYQQAAVNFDIIDFELQRQSRQKGPQPWAEGEEGWEPVDINVAKDILDTTAGYEPDVVNSVVTNGVITMPLPMRISGAWRTQATHDRIKNFVLTDEQVKIEMEMNRALLQEAVESKKTIRQTKVQRKGFNEFQFDSREIQGSLMGTENVYAGMSGYTGGGYGGGSSEYDMETRGNTRRPPAGRQGARGAVAANPLEQLIAKLADDSENPQEKEKLIRNWITERASVDGELLLFRYFDFSVEPGKTYRYRVRFILQNPNFGKRIADAGGLAHVVAGETRTTDWSNVTDPVKIPEDMNFFLTRVNEPKGSGRLLPSAQMDVYHWDSKYGTMVNKAFEVRLGQTISESLKAEVIDVAGQTVEEMDYAFTADSFVVDAIEDINIDRNFHGHEKMEPNLRLELLRGFRERFRNLGQVLVKDDEQDLAVHTEASDVKQHEYMKAYIKQQKEHTFKHLFDAKSSLTDASGYGEYADLYGEGMESTAEGMGMYGSGGRGRSSLRRKSGGSRGSSSSQP